MEQIMEQIKEIILSLPLDWIFHGTNVPVRQMLLLGVPVAAVCLLLAVLSGLCDRVMYPECDNQSGIAYTSFMVVLIFGPLRRIAELVSRKSGRKEWRGKYSLTNTREYSSLKIAMILPTWFYFLNFGQANGGGFAAGEVGIVVKDIDPDTISLTAYVIAAALAFLLLAVLFSLIHRTFFMTAALYVGASYLSLVFIWICGNIGVFLYKSNSFILFIANMVWFAGEIFILMCFPPFHILYSLFKIVISDEGEVSLTVPTSTTFTVPSNGGFVPGSDDDDDDGDSYTDDSHGLSHLPTIIYDDSNEAWYKQYTAGDHVIYRQKDGGRTVYIYNADVSFSGANTSEGYFHWY